MLQEKIVPYFPIELLGQYALMGKGEKHGTVRS